MKKAVRFHAALIMMCVVAFSVSLGSCDKNEVDSQDENSLSLKVDTNGVSFTLTPLINWNANLADVEKYMAKYFPDFDICDNGELKYDETCEKWTLKYESKINMGVSFIFGNEQGDGLQMTNFKFTSSCNVDKIREELSGLGFKFLGLVYTDVFPEELEYMYLSNDEKLEVQFIVYNCGDEDRWYLTFQSTDRNDLDYLIDESSLNINYDVEEGSYSFSPILDFDATVDDVRKFMADNCPDWEIRKGEELKYDTITDSIPHWYIAYRLDSLSVCYYFNDEEGEEFDDIQYVCNLSTDITPIVNELTRNGLIYLGKESAIYDEQLCDYYVYAPLSKEYNIIISSWDLYGGSWSLDICKYNEELVENLE